MATIITEISKYLIIFFMVLYTIKCFTVLKPVREDKKESCIKCADRLCVYYTFFMLSDTVFKI